MKSAALPPFREGTEPQATIVLVVVPPHVLPHVPPHEHLHVLPHVLPHELLQQPHHHHLAPALEHEIRQIVTSKV